MSTFIYQVTSGSATAASDLGNILGAIRNDALVQINPTDLRWGFLATDGAGRLVVTGTLGVSASNLTANVTQGTNPWVVSGQVSATAHQDGIWGVTGTVTASATVGQGGTWVITAVATAVSASAQITGIVTATPASSTALTADGIGAVSGQTVAGFNFVHSSGANTWDRWNGMGSGNATASGVGVGAVAPFWHFDDNSTQAAQENFFGVPRMNSSRIIYVTSTAALQVQQTAVTATATNSDGYGAISGQVVVAFGYVKSSAGNNSWNRWCEVPSGGTASGGSASAMPMVTFMGQRTDTPLNLGDTLWGAPRLDASRSLFITASAGNWGVSGTVTASVSGQNAHAATTAGNPVRIGLVAAKMGAAPATAGDASGVNLYGTRYGQMFVLGGGPHVQFKEYDLTAATGFFQAVSGNTGEIIYVTEAGCFYDSNASANINFRLAFASAHNATGMDAAITATANTMLNNPIIRASALVPGGSVIRGNGGGIIASGADGCSILASCTAPGARRITFWFSYYVVSG